MNISPLPWKSDMSRIMDANGEYIAVAFTGSDAQSDYDATFITHAANCHAELVAALVECRDALDGLGCYGETLANVRIALSNAKATPPTSQPGD